MKKSVVILVSLFVLAGCHTSAESKYYALSSTPDTAVKASVQDHTFVLNNITIPGMLDRPQIVMKSGQNEIKILELYRWAEPLDTMIHRVLSDDLIVAMHAHNILPNNRQISIAINEFDADETGKVVLKAAWTEKTIAADLSTTTINYSFEKNEKANSQDINTIVAAMSHLLSELADTIISQPQ